MTNTIATKVGFGTWGIGGDSGPLSGYGPTNDSDSLDAVRFAFDHGIEFFDTAPPYGNGKSEELLGIAFSGYTHQPKILTKVGVNIWGEQPCYAPSFIDESLEKSFLRLRVKNIDSVIFHSLKTFNQKTIEEGFKHLDKIKSDGKISRIGLSLKSPSDLLNCNKLIELIDIIEVNLNLLDVRVLDEKVLDVVKKYNIEVIARTPFAFGFLTESLDENSEFHPSDHRVRWSAEQKNQWFYGRKKLKDLFASYGFHEPIHLLALKFCLSFDFVEYVIPGMQSKHEVSQNLLVGDVRDFPKKLIEDLIAYAESFVLIDQK
ncbi:MAG: hypothetical protein CBC42_05375 [Betaproteobacteria bacterium TMED82]|nr:MAG: hypothetical protein CBC42_05375 [Betaproteobacteria bacterium TMED82]